MALNKSGNINETFEDFQKQAQEKLNYLNDKLGGNKKENSVYFMSMKNALEDVAQISEGEHPEAIAQAIDRLQKAAAEYAKERGGFGGMFRSQAGKDRVKGANDLVSFCQSTGQEMKDYVNDNKYRKHLENKVREAKKAEEERRRAAEEEVKRREEYNKKKTAEAAKRRGSSSVEVDYILDLKEKAKEQLDAFKKGQDPAHKNSEVFTKMQEALEKVANMENWASLDDARQALNGLQVASENYIKERKGAFKSKTGKERLAKAEGLLDFAHDQKGTLERAKVDLQIEKYQKGLKDISKIDFYEKTTMGFDQFDYNLAQVITAETLKNKFFDGDKTLNNSGWRINKGAEDMCRVDKDFQKWAKDIRENDLKEEIANKSPSEIKAEYLKVKTAEMNRANQVNNVPQRKVPEKVMKQQGPTMG